MERLKMSLLLHFFQPYWQFQHIFKKIVDERYRPIFRFLREKRIGFGFTANINYSLLELLEKYGEHDVLRDIGDAARDGQIELMGAAAYHPIIPLLPEKEIKKQIAQDFRGKKSLRISRNSNGFFFPEMAFSKDALAIVKKYGYSWTVVEDVAVEWYQVPKNRILQCDDFIVFLRSSHWSKYVWDWHLDFWSFADKLRYELPSWTGGSDSYLVIALDAETFGHHVPGLNENFLFPMMEHWGGKKVVRFEELLRCFPLQKINPSELRSCSWATSCDDLYHGDSYPLWKSAGNIHHQRLWDLINLALIHADSPEAIHPCLKIVNSCHFWWISGKPYWNPGFMMPAADKALEIVNDLGTTEEKIQAKQYHDKLLSLVH